MTGRRGLVAIVAVLGAASLIWMLWPEGDAGAIRRRLQALAAEANERAGDGLGTVAKAARIAGYFTEDVIVDLGQGTAPISGRDTLIGMTARLQPRTASVVVALEDVTVAGRAGTALADVSLTATFTPRDAGGRDQPMDARELAIEMRKDGGEWRIARVTAVDTLR